MAGSDGHHAVAVAAMVDGIGSLSFATEEWVAAAAERLGAIAARHRAALADLGAFTLCEVAHNAPAHLHAGTSLAWHLRFDGAKAEVNVGELPPDACDLKIEGDHSIMSNLGRLRVQGGNPAFMAAARARLLKLSRWEMRGAFPQHEALGVALRSLHDAMSGLTMPRFVFMTPEWVSTARHILTERAERFAASLREVNYTFAEEFTDTPRYAFPDGSHGGFWVRCERGLVTVGAGPLPAALAPADGLTKGPYSLAVPVGRTVEAAMTEEEKTQRTAYSKVAFRANEAGEFPMTQSSPSGKGRMPPALMRVFAPLHDELSKRTSGDLPTDYEAHASWPEPQPFDRMEGYDPSWLRFDAVDIYGNPRLPATA